jgi:hypothetical protein
MRRTRMVCLGWVLCLMMMFGGSTAFAQEASGAVPPPGVKTPARLPATGEAATDDGRALSLALLGGASIMAGLIVRRRAQRDPWQRRSE